MNICLEVNLACRMLVPYPTSGRFRTEEVGFADQSEESYLRLSEHSHLTIGVVSRMFLGLYTVINVVTVEPMCKPLVSKFPGMLSTLRSSTHRHHW